MINAFLPDASVVLVIFVEHCGKSCIPETLLSISRLLYPWSVVECGFSVEFWAFVDRMGLRVERTSTCKSCLVHTPLQTPDLQRVTNSWCTLIHILQFRQYHRQGPKFF
jgi:hypothetical protein